MGPRNRQDQYKCSGSTLPQRVRKLLKALKCIEKAFTMDKDHEEPKSGNKQRDTTKRKMKFFDERILKG